MEIERTGKMIVITHAETEWNAEGKLQGHLDSPLTKKGLAQAEATASAVKNFKVNAIYSSDLGRSIKTAECIGNLVGNNIEIDSRLRERNLGAFQGLTVEDAKNKYGPQYTRFFETDIDFVGIGGESMRQHYKSNTECFEELLKKHPDDSIVIVTHSGVLSNFFKHANRIPLNKYYDFKTQQCSLNIFRGTNGKNIRRGNRRRIQLSSW